MMIKAQIKNGNVTNIIVVDPNNVPDWCADWPEATETCEIGGSYVGGTFFPAPKPEPVAPTLQQQKAARAEAYRLESDPIFFMVQRGESTNADWLAKIAEIKARFPYPEVTA